MIVVVPDAHALPFETIPATSPDFWANLSPSGGKTSQKPTRSFSTTSFVLSKPAITSAMSLESEPLRVFQWAGFNQ